MRILIRTPKVVISFLQPKHSTQNTVSFTTTSTKRQIFFFFSDLFELKPLKINVLRVPQRRMKKANVRFSKEDFDSFYKKLGDSLKINQEEMKKKK